MSTNGSTTSNGGTFLTVPASTVWNGYITLSGTLASGTGASGAASAAPSIQYNCADGNYADGTIVTKLQLNTPAQLLGTLSGTVDHGDVAIGPITIQARSVPATLTLNLGSATAACATSIGE